MRARWMFAAVLVLAAFVGVRRAPAPALLQPCEAGQGRGATPAECGVVTVLENRTSQRGRTIGIHFMVIRGERQPAREALFMFAGGPGQGSIATYAAAAWPR